MTAMLNRPSHPLAFLPKLLIICLPALLLCSCIKDPAIILDGGRVILDLGEDYQEPGYKAENTTEEVSKHWHPAFNPLEVNHYVIEYSTSDAKARRDVFVRSNLLAGEYLVRDSVHGTGQLREYSMVVEPSEVAFNQLVLEGFGGLAIQLSAEVMRAAVTIQRQSPDDWPSGHYVEAYGTYDGRLPALLSLEYTMVYAPQPEMTDTLIGKLSLERVTQEDG